MLDHVEIYVSDLKRTRLFYDNLLLMLGWELYQEWSLGFSYRYKDYYLVFVQTEDSFLEYEYHRKRVGLNHLAFQVDTTSEVDRIRDVLLKNGVNELYSKAYPYAGGERYYAFFFEDPDRVKLEIVYRSKASEEYR